MKSKKAKAYIQHQYDADKARTDTFLVNDWRQYATRAVELAEEEMFQHLSRSPAMRQYSYTFDNRAEADHLKTMLDARKINYESKSYTLFGDPFTDIIIDIQSKPVVDKLYVQIPNLKINQSNE